MVTSAIVSDEKTFAYITADKEFDDYEIAASKRTSSLMRQRAVP